MSKQSGDTDGPRQQMTGGNLQRHTAELYSKTTSLNPIRPGPSTSAAVSGAK